MPSFTPSPVIATHVAPLLECVGDAQLVLRDTGDDHAVPVEQAAEVLVATGQVGARHYERVGAGQAHFAGARRPLPPPGGTRALLRIRPRR